MCALMSDPDSVQKKVKGWTYYFLFHYTVHAVLTAQIVCLCKRELLYTVHLLHFPYSFSWSCNSYITVHIHRFSWRMRKLKKLRPKIVPRSHWSDYPYVKVGMIDWLINFPFNNFSTTLFLSSGANFQCVHLLFAVIVWWVGEEKSILGKKCKWFERWRGWAAPPPPLECFNFNLSPISRRGMR